MGRLTPAQFQILLALADRRRAPRLGGDADRRPRLAWCHAIGADNESDLRPDRALDDERRRYADLFG